LFVIKRGKGGGFSGIENPLFFKPVTAMLYGDAKSSLTHLVTAVQEI
jgi:NAD(P) transhydrogenase subunit beta